MGRGVVLVADDDSAVRMVVNQALTRAGFDVHITSNFSNLWQWIENGEGDCVISDVIMPDGDAFEILPLIKEARSDLPVILISAQNTFMTALKAQEGGAFEYLPKPFDLDKLVSTVERAVSEPRINPPRASTETYADEMPIIGRSDQMQGIYQAIARMRHSQLPVLLSGESGTGKSLVARVLHNFGDRSAGPFEKITFSGMSAGEIERVMFGGDGQSGVVSRTTNGTLFLNEILDIPLQIQARVLQWLDSMEKGDTGPDVRIISSTSSDLDGAVGSGGFREDLYYRLSVVPLKLPPLRERPEDVPDLARHFLKKSALDGTVASHIEPDGMRLLKGHLWPGNVRELENLVRRLGLLHARETITSEDIEGQMDNRNVPLPLDMEETVSGFPTLREATQHFADRYFDIHGAENSNDDVYHRFLAEFEEPLIVATLRATNGNQIKAAELLGLNRNTLRKKINIYKIKIVKTVGK